MVFSNQMSNSLPVEISIPITIKIDPMERLLLINFEKDSDNIYIGFEPQVFNDAINGIGHLIIGWRKDKKIDVCHQKSLHPDPSKYNIAGAGLNEMIMVEMDKAVFIVNDYGVQAHYQFHDILNRKVEIKINEKNSAKRKPFGLLAPMGDAATHPEALPLIFLQDFYFVRKDHTELKLSIDNRSHIPDLLPMRMDGEKMTFIRYSPKPLIITLNTAFNGNLKSFELIPGMKYFEK